MRTGYVLSILLLASAVSAPARATDPPAVNDASSARADELAKRGVELSKKQQWKEAEALFREALSLKRAYDIAGNLGLAEAALGKTRDAAEHLSFALARFPANGKPAHRELLKEKLAEVRAKLGAITIDVSVKGAEVLVDGASVGTAPLDAEVFVSPGKHTVMAKLAGHINATSDVNAVAGQAHAMKLVMVVEAPPPPPLSAATPPTRVRPPPVWPAIAAGGVAALLLGVGGGLYGKSASERERGQTMANDILASGKSCVPGAANFASQCAELESIVRGSDTMHNAAVGMFVGGSALAVGAAVYGVWAAVSPRKQMGWSVRPQIGLGAAGVEGSF